MATEPQLTKKDLSVPEMGVSFSEIRSDEQHEAVDGRKAEVPHPYAPGLAQESHPINRERVFDVTRAFENEHSEMGTIVSDKRRTSPGFLTSVGHAFKEWWGGTKETLKTPILPTPTKPAQPHTIARAETRAEVIKKAIAPDSIAPKDDHRVVVQKFRTFKQDVARATGAPLTIKEPGNESSDAPHAWAHTVPVSDTKKVVSPKPEVVHAIPPIDVRKTMIAPIVAERAEETPHDILRKKLTNGPAGTSPAPQTTPANVTVPDMVHKENIPLQAKAIQIAPTVAQDSIQWATAVEEEPVKELGTFVDEFTPTPPSEIQKGTPILKEKTPSRISEHISISAIPMTMPTSVPEQARILASLPKMTPRPRQESVVAKQTAPTVVPAPTVERIPDPEPVHIVMPTVERPAIEKPTPQPIPSTPAQPIIVPVSQPRMAEPAVVEKKFTPREPEHIPVKPSIEAVKSAPALKPSATLHITEPRLREEFHSTQTPTEPVLKAPVTQKPTPVLEKVAKKSDTNSIVKWILLALIALVGVVLAVIASMYFNGETDTTQPETSVTQTPLIPSFFAVDTQIAVPLESDGRTFLTTLRDTITTAPKGVVQFYPTLPSDTTTRPASSAEILSFLQVGLNEKAQRTIEDTMMLGSITTTKNEPYLIIQSYNFDVLFSGMLTWEKNMYADFAPVFGSSYTEVGTFSDMIVKNKSVRVLSDRSNKPVLLYSFIDQNTVVITESVEALGMLIEKFKDQKNPATTQ